MATASKKTSSRKSARPAVKRTNSVAALATNVLPASFVPEGFEKIGNELRVWGTVNPQHYEPSEPVPAITPIQVQASPRAPRPLVDAIDSYARRLDEMSNALDNLEDVAQNVLLPEGPHGEAGTASSSPEPVQSPVLGQMHNLTGRLERLINRVNYIASRVQA